MALKNADLAYLGRENRYHLTDCQTRIKYRRPSCRSNRSKTADIEPQCDEAAEVEPQSRSNVGVEQQDAAAGSGWSDFLLHTLLAPVVVLIIVVSWILMESRTII